MTTATDSTPKTCAEAPNKGVGSSDLFGLLRTANRLTEIHSTVTRFFGDKWPTHRDQWQAIIRAKAAKENKQELAAAVELAKGSPEPMQSLVILAAAYAVTGRGAAQPAEKLSTTMTTDPDGKPYTHNAEQVEAHKLARAEGEGPVSNETARAYFRAYPRDDEETPAERYDREVFGDEWNTPMSL